MDIKRKLEEEAANSASDLGLVMARGKKSELAYEGGGAKGKKRKSESVGMSRRHAKRKSESAGMSGMEAKGKSESAGMSGMEAKGKRESAGMSRGHAKGKSGGGCDWAALPEGIVDYIGDLLLAEDVTEYIHLRGACASWRRATLEPGWCWRFRPRNWILISRQDDLPHCTFLNLSTAKRIRAHVPELSHCHTTFLRVTDGLIIFMNDASPLLHLLNPFTGNLTPLPPLFLLLARDRCHLQPKDVPYVVRGLYDSFNLAPCSSSSSIIVVIFFSETFAYAKPGDAEWSSFTFPKCLPSVQCFQDRLYSLCIVKRELSRFDPHQNRFTTLYPCLSDPTSLSDSYKDACMKHCFLVASEEELLVVCWYCNGPLRSSYCIKVCKLDLENGTLIPKKSIGERAIFICNTFKAFSVSTSTFSSVIPNSIYFTTRELFGISPCTAIYHPIGCACCPQHRQFLEVPGPSSWVLCHYENSARTTNCLNWYCRAY